MKGVGTIFKRGDIYWIRYKVDGVWHRESSHTDDADEAGKFLANKITAAGIEKPRVISFADLAEGILTDYRAHNRRSIGSLKHRLASLEAEFGKVSIHAITRDRLNLYVEKRIKAGAKPATVKLELSAFHRAFVLAGIPIIPRFPTITLDNARQGFLTRAQLESILTELGNDQLVRGDMEAVKAPIRFAALTGWRIGEIRALKWQHIDFEAGVIHIPGKMTKNRDARTFPFDVLPELKELLVRQRGLTRELEIKRQCVIPSVFHQGGEPFLKHGIMRGAWKRACIRAGLPGILIHDLRRSAARNLVNAGVPEHVVMKLMGHKTPDMFRRYAIVSIDDMRSAVSRLARKNGDTNATSLHD